MALGAPLVLGSRRSARAPLTLISNGWLSAVPRKFAPGSVPVLPSSAQPLDTPPVAEICRLLPLGVMLTFGPALSVTESERPLRERTTVPLAMLGAVTAFTATL